MMRLSPSTFHLQYALHLRRFLFRPLLLTKQLQLRLLGWRLVWPRCFFFMHVASPPEVDERWGHHGPVGDPAWGVRGGNPLWKRRLLSVKNGQWRRVVVYNNMQSCWEENLINHVQEEEELCAFAIIIILNNLRLCWLFNKACCFGRFVVILCLVCS